MKIALCQINTTIGDFPGNRRKIIDGAEAARKQGASLVIFPELAVTGYPPRDLLLRPGFVDRAWRTIHDIAGHINGIDAVVGCIEPNTSGVGKLLYNGAAFVSGGRVKEIARKSLLPTYDVFDENRYFESFTEELIVVVGEKKVGLSICEDAWNDVDFWPRPLYHTDPIENISRHHPDLIINISASPYATGKEQLRCRMLCHQATKYSIPFFHVNQVGGNDDLIFAGNSMVIGKDGVLAARGAAFAEDFLIVDDDLLEAGGVIIEEDHIRYIYEALLLGIRDYAGKCGFDEVVLGLSGGIDSAVTAALARFALGPQSVLTVTMPSRFTSVGSLSDARALSKALGVRLVEIPIERMYRAYIEELAGTFGDRPEDVTEENIQARIRGNVLMALSNKFGYLVLSTGNKSELATGYCTLYGDMSGGLAVISDVPKTVVYELAAYINSLHGDIIPDSIMTKAPSAELKPDQADQDSLPPYEVLDGILRAFIEDNLTDEQIAELGYDPDLVDDVLRMVNRNEYKRRQAPPGLKISPQAFGIGWRMPIAQKYHR